jgi:hypothetical protein
MQNNYSKNNRVASENKAKDHDIDNLSKALERLNINMVLLETDRLLFTDKNVNNGGKEK